MRRTLSALDAKASSTGPRIRTHDLQTGLRRVTDAFYLEAPHRTRPTND